MNEYVVGTKLVGHWRRLSEHRLKGFGPKQWNKVHGALQAIGFYFQREVRERVHRGEYAENHPFTILMKSVHSKGSEVPLIDTAQMINSVKNYKYGSYHDPVLFVGIPKSATHSTSLFTQGGIKSTYQLAKLMEHGMTIHVTPKMRRFLAANGLRLKSDTKVLHIPKRPFISSVAKDPAFTAWVNKTFKTSMEEIWYTE